MIFSARIYIKGPGRVSLVINDREIQVFDRIEINTMIRDGERLRFNYGGKQPLPPSASMPDSDVCS